MVELYKIRKIIFIFAAVLVLLVNCPGKVYAQDSDSGLYIENFKSEISILDDSWLEIIETIDVFYITDHHGIYRTIPYRYHDYYSNVRNIRIEVKSVQDEYGRDYQFEKTLSNGNLLLKIGDANTTIKDSHTYVITYKVWGAINYFGNEAEFYWNATGDDWQIPINNSETKINISDENCLKITGFQGRVGSKEKVKESFDNKCSWQSTRTFSSGEGLTIVARWPKELTPPQGVIEKIIYWLVWNWIYFIPVIVLILTFFVFKKKGLDPKASGTVIAEFEPPNNLTPLELGSLYDNRAEGKDFSALIIDFAVKGYLKIEELKKDGIFAKNDFCFIKVKNLPDSAKSFEQTVYNKIFEDSDKIKLSDLSEKFYNTKRTAEKEVFAGLVDDKYYDKSPLSAGVGNYVVGSILSFLGFFIAPILEETNGISFASVIFSFILSGTIVVIFGLFMSRRTKYGAEIREKIAGFKLYLETAEKHRLKFAEEEKYFEKYLPYAMVLGVAEIWAKKFKDIYKKSGSPRWYSGYHGSSFSAYAFTSSLNNNFSTSVNKSFSSTPASSGSSGFSGGGGGGFGGGGGGGW